MGSTIIRHTRVCHNGHFLRSGTSSVENVLVWPKVATFVSLPRVFCSLHSPAREQALLVLRGGVIDLAKVALVG